MNDQSNQQKNKPICKLKTDTEELCVPCEIANAVIAFAAIEEAHPGKIDTSLIDKELEKGTDSLEQWLKIIDEMKSKAKGSAAVEAEMVTQHLYQLVCEDEGR